jgi:hypothetical protein
MWISPGSWISVTTMTLITKCGYLQDPGCKHWQPAGQICIVWRNEEVSPQEFSPSESDLLGCAVRSCIFLNMNKIESFTLCNGLSFSTIQIRQCLHYSTLCIYQLLIKEERGPLFPHVPVHILIRQQYFSHTCLEIENEFKICRLLADKYMSFQMLFAGSYRRQWPTLPLEVA